jgi:hypothetical protein
VGKRRKRLTMAKYAKKYAAVREAVFGKKEEEMPVLPVVSIEEPKVEEVVEEPKVEVKIVPKPKAKKAPAKKKTSTKTKAKSKTKKTTVKKTSRKKK